MIDRSEPAGQEKIWVAAQYAERLAALLRRHPLNFESDDRSNALRIVKRITEILESTAVVLVLMFGLSDAAHAADHSIVLHGLASRFDEPQALACGGRHRGHSDPRDFAAHRTLPCGARVRVCLGARCTDVTIMDRGPYVRGRIIDLFPAPAAAIGLTLKRGVAPVTVKVTK